MELLSVPHLRQSPGYCGPSSLRAVLAYFCVKKSEVQLARLAGATRKKGVGALGLVKAACELGFRAKVVDRASMVQLRRLVNIKKIPVIVDWFSTDDGHYSVAIGFDRKKIYLMDPELGGVRTMNLGDFERVWFDFSGPVLRSPSDLYLRRMIVVQPRLK